MVAVEERSPTDRLFHALADPTRRAIVEQTLIAGSSVSALARRHPMSIAAVQKHVTVLEGAGLVWRERRGREQIVRADPEALRRAHAALDALEETWRARIRQMGEILADRPEGATR